MAAPTPLRTALRLGALAAALALGGCALGLVPMAATSDVAAIATTRKTSLDYVASFVTGSDCSLRNSGLGRSYCEPEPEALPAPAAYCYRTLGDVTCYDTPQPGQRTTLLR